MTQPSYIKKAHKKAMKQYKNRRKQTCQRCKRQFKNYAVPNPVRIIKVSDPYKDDKKNYSPGWKDNEHPYCPPFKEWFQVHGIYCSEKCVRKEPYNKPVLDYMFNTKKKNFVLF